MMNASGRTTATPADMDLALRIFSAACAVLSVVMLFLGLFAAIL
jgi:adenosylcobinamide-phosphate synthase